MKKISSLILVCIMSITSMALAPLCVQGAAAGTWKLIKTNYIVAEHLYDDKGRGGYVTPITSKAETIGSLQVCILMKESVQRTQSTVTVLIRWSRMPFLGILNLSLQNR